MENYKDLFKDIAGSLEDLYAVHCRTVNNQLVSQYYDDLKKSDPSCEGKASRISKCGKIYTLGHHKRLELFDYRAASWCKDQFCVQCQRLKSRARLVHYFPMLKKVSKDYDLYMLTLTAKNVAAQKYNNRLDRFIKSYNKLHRILAGYQKISGFDLTYLGYVGSVRSIETTFNGNEYHPHIHAILALEKHLYFPRNSLNIFSNKYVTKYKEGKRRRELNKRVFSEFETYIQRLWWLLMNDKKITEKSIKDLNENEMYSCTLDFADAKVYTEVFKYAIKSFDEKQQHITFDQFKTLYYAHKGRQTIQGYGIFRKKVDEKILDERQLITLGSDIRTALRIIDMPQNVHVTAEKFKQMYLRGERIINLVAVHNMTAETHQEVYKMISQVLNNYYKNRICKDFKFKAKYKFYEVFEEEFYTKCKQRDTMREHMREAAETCRKEKYNELKQRSQQRTKYVTKRLEALKINRNSPLYESTKLHLKRQFNNTNPLRKRFADTHGNNLPF